MREALKYINRSLGSSNYLVGAEIGVRTGKNALSMLESMPTRKVYLIDHYEKHLESSGNFVSFTDQHKFYKEMFVSIQPYLDRAVLVSMPSVFASTLFSDEYFDFVYVDGRHGYADVMEDLTLWYPKVKKNGVLCGHDFGNKSTPEVELAVRDFCNSKGLELFKMDDLDWVTRRR